MGIRTTEGRGGGVGRRTREGKGRRRSDQGIVLGTPEAWAENEEENINNFMK